MQEILDTAIEVMAKDGVAGLSMAEVARRVGVRPPSLYQYFPSKMAIYDALFERGGRESADVLEHYSARLAEDPRAVIVAGQQAGVAWAMANPVLAQLLYWRPVPNFEPTPQAYEPSVRLLEVLRSALQAAVHAGQLAPEAADDEGVALYTALVSGVISQQLANEPSTQVEEGRFARLTGTAVDMFFRYYAPKEGE
ncbi:TetR/AcrR family transcriptional regulator [Streptomyces sp. NPDC001635]